MDGAGPWQIYWSIMLPLAKPAVATVAVLQFLARWGDLLWPVPVARGDRHAALPAARGLPPGQWPGAQVPDLESRGQAADTELLPDLGLGAVFTGGEDGTVFHEVTRKLVTKGLGHWEPPKRSSR